MDNATEPLKVARWVQSKYSDGKGKKFLVKGENPEVWSIEISSPVYSVWVPKEEYVLCEAPEVWENVTHQMSCESGKKILHNLRTIASIHGDDNKRDCSFLPYRFELVQVGYIGMIKPGMAIIIEKLKQA